MLPIVFDIAAAPAIIALPGLPVITGTPQVGRLLTASTGTWKNVPTSFAYQWNRAGTPIAGAKGSSYTPITADVGNTLTVSVIATNSIGSSPPATSAATRAITAATAAVPVNTSAPTVSGTAQVGQTLTATNGTWTNSPTSFAYQWNRAGTPIGGATSSTYVPVVADIGSTLTMSVIATNSGGSSAPATSAATAAVIDIAPTINTTASILGIPQVGVGTTAVDAVWNRSVTSLAYQWKAAGVNATGTGATTLTYTPVVGDVGKTLTISVTATNTGGTSAPSTSAASAATIDIIPTNSVAPTISGTTQVGQTLTATTGTWANRPTSFAYQWKSAGVNATGAGATTASYTAATADIGKTLTMSVIATNSGGSSAPATSAATAAIIAAPVPANTARPAISGTAQVGQVLTASSGAWTNSPTSYAYQWQREGTNISGATSPTYTLLPADLGALITVQVTASNSAGASLPAISALAGPVIGTTVFYVSQSGGLDTNPGTLAAPWKTLSKVNAATFSPGTSILFKRGDIWRDGSNAGTGRLRVKSGASGNPLHYDAYGSGPNPTILGSVAADTTGDWINISGNIWKSNRTFPLIGANPNGRPFDNANDVGNVTWGTYPNRSFGVMVALPGQSDSSLTTQGQWLFNTTDFKVHIFSVGNPATAMPGLELCVNASIIEATGTNFATVQNFTILNGAGSGVNYSACNGLTFRDLTIGWIGGGNLGGNGVRYGNGTIASSDTTNTLVERNYVFECYDGGITQESVTAGVSMTNLTYRNNVCYNCAASLMEIGLDSSGGSMSNILVYNNTCSNPQGWGKLNRPGEGINQSGLNAQSTVVPTTAFNVKNNTFSRIASITLGVDTATWGQGVANFDYNNWLKAPFADPSITAPMTAHIRNPQSDPPFSTWTSGYAPAQEANSLIDLDPLLVNYTLGVADPSNLAPKTGSPLLGAGTNLFGSGVVWDFNKQPRPASGPFTIGAFQTTPTPFAFPGQAGNPVGFAAAPGYPGSLTLATFTRPLTNGTPGNPQVYSFLDFDLGTASAYIDSTQHDIDFYGCRFQSNNVTGANVDLAGATNIRFFYCSFVPRAALVGTTPPNAAWPSAGAGTGVVLQPNTYMIASANGYQYGVNCSTGGTGGSFTLDHCDIWGCQNAIAFYSTTAQIIVNNSWIHDFADSNGGVFHQDGPGYLNGTTGPTNVSITNNTIASIMNGFPISFQVAATSPSRNILIKRNYICGGSDAIILQNTSTISFIGNVLGTDIPWQFDDLYRDYTADFNTTGNIWKGNTLNIRPGTVPYPGVAHAWTSGQQGYFLWPDGTWRATDF